MDILTMSQNTAWGTGSSHHQLPGGTAHNGTSTYDDESDFNIEQNNFTWPRARGLDASRSISAPPFGFDLGSFRQTPPDEQQQQQAMGSSDLFFSNNEQRPISSILEGASSYKDEQRTSTTLPSVLENKSENVGNSSILGYSNGTFREDDFPKEPPGFASVAGLVTTRSHSAAPRPTPQMNISPPPGILHSLQRPASTGVIGQQNQISEDPIVRPNSKTLMELIQEDFPKTPSPEFNHDGSIRPVVRPRSASPPRSSNFPIGDVPRRHGDVTVTGRPSAGDVTTQPGHVTARPNDVHYHTPAIPSHHISSHVPHEGGAHPVVTVVNQQPANYVSIPVQHRHAASAAPSNTAPHMINQVPPLAYHHSPYDMPHPPNAVPAVYYTQQPDQVYVTAANPSAPFFTVQYAAPPPPRHVIHPEYISVAVPVHDYYYRGAAPQGVTVSQQETTSQGVSDGRSAEVSSRKKVVTKKEMKRNKAKAMGGGSGGGKGSALLEDFRANGNGKDKDRKWTIENIRGHVVEFCLDQNGSRFIQQRLEVALPSEKQLVLAEVLPSIHTLRNDVFGNYVVQKLLEHGTPPTKALLRQTLTGEMYTLSLQMYGCRVVQKALETLQDPSLLLEFHPHVIPLIHDQNGNHVMQKCIEIFSHNPDQIQFIIDDVLNDVSELSRHPYGCRVMQRILEHCDSHQKVAALNKVKSAHKSLLDDQYGNYVIQHVIRFGRNDDRQSLMNIVLQSGLLILSRQKFASNVLEKLLKFGSKEQKKILVREMLNVVPEKDGGETSVVLLMVKDAYANYVVQTTLDVLEEGEERKLLLDELNRNAVQLRNYTFAKHIVAKLN